MIIPIKLIRTEDDHKAALSRIDALMDGEDRSAADTQELAALADLVEAYEREHFPIALPGTYDMLSFVEEQRAPSGSAQVPKCCPIEQDTD